MSEKLKPCPFCGGKADIKRELDVDLGGTFYSVQCRSCRASSGDKYASEDCPQLYEEVREKWDTRKEQPHE